MARSTREQQTAYMRAWRDANREKNRAYQRSYKVARRRTVIEHYGGKCACCDEATFEFLAIDHIDGGGTQHRAEVGSGGVFIDWLIKNGFPAGYAVLCRNCNMAKGFYGLCPHQRSK